MILWTIQPEDVYKEILETGVYRCDFSKADIPDFRPQYNWLVQEMRKRIGDPPAGVQYPVWAWYQWTKEHPKPDLRWERWNCGYKGEKFVRLEIEIPDGQVVLSDFELWCMTLNHAPISFSDSEDDLLRAKYESLDDAGQKKMMDKNWQRVFDMTPFENDWIRRGDCIQATFWELRKEQIREVTHFVSTCSIERAG